MAKKRETPTLDEIVSQWPEYSNELRDASDRAVGVLGPAYLDFMLERLLRAHFRGDGKKATKTADEILSGNGAAGTFSGRTKLAWALGLIDDREAHDLNGLRDVRNIFAHGKAGLTFSNDQSIRDLCAGLLLPKDVDWHRHKPAPRDLFVASTALLFGSLMSRIRSAKHQVQPRKVVAIGRHEQGGGVSWTTTVV